MFHACLATALAQDHDPDAFKKLKAKTP